MAPNFKKMKAFGKNKSLQPAAAPLRQYDQDDLEAGQFLPETQNQYANIDVGAPKPGGGGAYLDEYRS